jgi:diamine N-acetyltransferase
MANLLLRLALPSDVDILRTVALKTFEEAFKHRNPADSYEIYTKKTFSTEQVALDISEPNTQTWLVFSGEQLIGYMRLKQTELRPELKPFNQIHLQRLYILQSHQAVGAGSLLMQEAYRQLANAGGGWLWLVVWLENHEAIAYYKHKGYQYFGRYDFVFGTEVHHDFLYRIWVGSR